MALTYLDASVLVALFLDDAFGERADRALQKSDVDFVVSDFAAAEFASSVARHVRMGEVTRQEAADAFSDFDLWLANSVARVSIDPADIRLTETILRRLELPLRAPDALHIAIAQRVGAELATFDERMATGARALGLPVSAV